MNSNSSEFRSCVKVEVDVPKVRTVPVDVKQHWAWPVQTELRSRVKVEVAVMGSPSLIVLKVSVDVYIATLNWLELRNCESRGGRHGLPVPNSPHSLCGRIATLNSVNTWTRSTRLHALFFAFFFFFSCFFFFLFFFFFFYLLGSITLLSLAGDSGGLTWVRHNSRKSSSTRSCQCVQYFRVSFQAKIWLLVFRIFNVSTDVDACDCTQRGCTDTVTESPLKVDSGKK